MPKNETDKALETIAAGAGVIAAGTVVGRVAGYGFRYLVALISPEAMGVFSLCLTLIGIASTVAFLGLGGGLVRYVAFYRGREDWPRVKGTILTSLKTVLGMSLVVSAVVALGAKPLARNLFHRPEGVAYVLFIAALLPLYTAKFVFHKCLTAFKEIAYRVAVFNVMENAAKILGCALLLLLGLKIWAALLGYGVAVVASLALGVYLLEFRVFAVFRSTTASTPNYGELMRYSTPLFFSGMVGLIMAWTDTLMISYFLTVEDVGYYSVAILLASLVMLGTELFLPLFMPSITEMEAQGNSEGIRDFFLTVTKWIFAVTLPIGVLLVAMPHNVLTLFFGSVYGVASVALVLLGVGNIVASVSFPAIRMIHMREKTQLYFWVTAAVSILNVGLNLWWIPRYGINGAAAATAVSLIVQAGAFLWFAYREFDYHAFTPAMGKLAIAGGGAALVAVLIVTRGVHSVATFLGTAVLLGLSYAGLAWLLGALEDKDRILWATLRTKFWTQRHATL